MLASLKDDDMLLLDFSSLLDSGSSELLDSSLLLEEESLEAPESADSELLEEDLSDALDLFESTALELDNSSKSPALEPLSSPQAANTAMATKESPRLNFRISTPFLRKP